MDNSNRKMLRDFTVDELDALPVGSRFVDLNEESCRQDSLAVYKMPGGEWRYDDGSGGFSSTDFLGYGCYQHECWTVCDGVFDVTLPSFARYMDSHPESPTAA